MKDRKIIDRQITQYKGNFHMHTQRSWDCEVPPAVALQEYRDKGYNFCAVTDHEVYWDSAELDSADFTKVRSARTETVLLSVNA